MPDMKQIHDFAVKWCDKFRDQNINYIDLVDHYMADDCVALGFEMDCGHAFSEKYGQAANNHEALNRIIYDVTDIPCLGLQFILNGDISTIGHMTQKRNIGTPKPSVVYSGIKPIGTAFRGESIYFPRHT